MLLESAALFSRCDSVQDKKKTPEPSKKINLLLKRTIKYDAELHTSLHDILISTNEMGHEKYLHGNFG